jgi:Domain of unknown function (DUF4345)
MDILQILQILAAVLTIVTGLVSFLRPRAVMNFTGLIVPGARGITEIRAVLGGAFIGLGAAPLLLGSKAAYQTLGITYLTIALTRIVGIAVDRSVERSNLISVATEIVMGVLLLL